MPIYEYRCGACGQEHETLQKVSEPPLTKCPACGKPKLKKISDPPMTVCTKCGKPAFEKMVTAAGFQLKGSGWYATDFKGSGKKPAEKKTEAKTDSKTQSKADSKTETKSDAKPASTPATTTD
jgi:putative FmdB family regulatory protein